MGNLTVRVCDFCGVETKYPVQDRWYRVSSLRWPIPTRSDGEPCETNSKDACMNCGTKISYILTQMGVLHEHSAPRTNSTGFILVY